MATIYTRAAKGSALTWTEGDANITNLNNAKIENVVEDLTPQLGGNLDVNGQSIVSASNGNILITPNGTGSIVLDGLNWPQTDGSANYVLKTNGSGQLSWTAQTTDTNTTYGISAETATGGVNLRLSGSDTTTDDVKLAEGSNITLTRTDANTITIASTASGGITLSDDTSTNATRYILFDDSTSGSQSAFNISSTKLTFNPSSGILTATGFNGPINGTIGATTANTGTFTTLTVNSANDLRLADSDSSNYVGFKAPTTVSANKIWTLPAADGSNGQVLSTDGSGTLSWATAGGGSISYALLKQSPNALTFTSSTTAYTTITGTYTEVTDASGISGTATNGFTLNAGTYEIKVIIRGLNFRNSANTAFGRLGFRLYNSTADSAVDIYDIAGEWDGIWESEAKRISFPPILLTNIVILSTTSTFIVGVRNESGETSQSLNFSENNGDAIRAHIIKLA